MTENTSSTISVILVAVDSTVAVGAELAIIADGAAATSAPAAAPVVQAPVAVVTPPPAPVAPVVAAAVASSSGTIVTMPALGESVTEGTVTRWLKNVGDQVAVDEALLEVSTDKVDTEIPSPASGTLVSIDVAVDSTVPVGARLAVIGGSGAPAAAVAPVAPVVAAPVTPPPAPVVAAPVAQVSNDDAYVTPIVRKFAAENQKLREPESAVVFARKMYWLLRLKLLRHSKAHLLQLHQVLQRKALLQFQYLHFAEQL